MHRPLAVAALLLAGCGPSTPPEDQLTPAELIPGQPAIPYPAALFSQRVEGEVLLLLVVDSSGNVMRDSSQVVKSSGHAEFDAAALAAAPGLHFVPAQRNGVKVIAPIQVPIHFAIPDSSRSEEQQ